MFATGLADGDASAAAAADDDDDDDDDDQTKLHASPRLASARWECGPPPDWPN